MDSQLKLRALIGKTLTKIEGATAGSGDVVFETLEGPRYLMTHHQGCCEHVRVTEVSEGIERKLGKVLTTEEQISDSPESSESGTVSLFIIGTENGEIRVKWLGESNGYYGEGVDFEEIK